STRLLAVIGDPVTHSLSPAMHNAALRALGLDAVYVALPTPAEALPPVLAALAAVGGSGNVTVPHKEAAERCMARKTDLCARVGACNTFWTERGELVGDNTDVPGVLACLRQLGVDGARRWLLVGTGGAARAGDAGAAGGRGIRPLLPRSRRPGGGHARRGEPCVTCVRRSSSCCSRRSAPSATPSCRTPAPAGWCVTSADIAGGPCGLPGAGAAASPSRISARAGCSPAGPALCASCVRRCGYRP